MEIPLALCIRYANSGDRFSTDPQMIKYIK